MNLPRFIQLSTLTTFGASLLNRDDSGLAKRLPFGGCTRTRISSQCLKRHWRTEKDDAHALTKAAEGLEMAVRSRRVFTDRLEKPLIEEGIPEQRVKELSADLQQRLFSGKTEGVQGSKKNKKNVEEEDAGRSEIVVMGEPEIRFLLDVIRELAPQNVDMKNWWKEHKAGFQALVYGAGVDAAMFGRFMAGDAASRKSAAVHVAHAFTVHAETSETDYFTAVDDLQEMGSGHINATELHSGIFYTYVVIDVAQLVSNLTGLPAEKWLEADREVAAALVRNLTHLVCTVSPGAKLGSTAPYARAWFVLAEVGEEQPRTLADAFLKPVSLREEDLPRAAAQKLAQYVQEYDAMYGDTSNRYVACLPQLRDIAINNARPVTVPELAEALAGHVRAGA